MLAISKRYYYKSGHADNPLLYVIYNFMQNTEDMYVSYSVYLRSVSRYGSMYFSTALPSPLHLFYLLRIVLIEVAVLLSV